MIAASDQRCWNHEGREAVCRCPECGRPYCRECVSEHQARLLCAPCQARVVAAVGKRRRRGWVAAAMFLGGLLIAWLVLFGAAQSIIMLAERSEQVSWHNR